jgi:hypothetical protein
MEGIEKSKAVRIKMIHLFIFVLLSNPLTLPLSPLGRGGGWGNFKVCMLLRKHLINPMSEILVPVYWKDMDIR